MIMLITLTILMSLMLFFMNHPMSVGILMISQTLILSIMSGMLLKSFWLSYMLLISILSGMLVLFIYMSSLASNEKFMTNNYINIFLMLMPLIGIFMSNWEKKIPMKSENLFLSSASKESLYSMKMMNMEFSHLTIMMVIYLFFSMIVSTMLVNIKEGPLRTNTYE